MSAGAEARYGDRPAPERSLTIGEVLTDLRPDFPDVTISKIRFLESEGLVEPERTTSGYRKFTPRDVARLRYVLECQRDRYLPLRIIREHLAAMDRGEPPPPSSAEPAAATDRAPEAPAALLGADVPAALLGADVPADVSDVRLRREELAAAAGLDLERLAEIERFGLIAPRSGGSSYDGDALVIAKTVAAMARHGVEPRHLRGHKTAADREIGLIEQIVSPYRRQRAGEGRPRAQEVVGELAALSVRLHAALLRAGLSEDLRR